MRSDAGAQPSSAASSVVLPAPAAPVMSRFSRRATASSSLARVSRVEHAPRLQRGEVGRCRAAARGSRSRFPPPRPAAARRARGCRPRAARRRTGVASSMCRPPRPMSATARSRTSSSRARHSGAGAAPVAAVDEEPGRAVDEEVGDVRIVEVARQRLEDRMPRGAVRSRATARIGRARSRIRVGDRRDVSPRRSTRRRRRGPEAARGWTTKRSGMRRS